MLSTHVQHVRLGVVCVIFCIISHFRVLETLTFKTRLNKKPFLVKMSFIFVRKKNPILINSFEFSLSLKQKLRATRKWPIVAVTAVCK